MLPRYICAFINFTFWLKAAYVIEISEYRMIVHINVRTFWESAVNCGLLQVPTQV